MDNSIKIYFTVSGQSVPKQFESAQAFYDWQEAHSLQIIGIAASLSATKKVVYGECWFNQKAASCAVGFDADDNIVLKRKIGLDGDAPILLDDLMEEE